MCRFVIVVILVSCVSFGVLAEVDTNVTCTLNDPELLEKKLEMRKCFKNIVDLHLKPDKIPSGDCYTATGFGEKIENIKQLMNRKCNLTLILDTTHIIKFIEFSLRNDSFKKFYDDITCVKKYEYNISNSCVKDKVGFFNVTAARRHTTWLSKANLKYNWDSCSTSKNVSNCVQAVLTPCSPHTGEYMANLFDYARELGNCSQYKSPVPPPGGTGAAAAPWLTTPICLLAVLMHVCVQKLKVR